MFHVPNNWRVRTGPMGTTDLQGNNGAFKLVLKNNQSVNVIATDNGGWEHVSVSREDRCPTWGEMCAVKNMFWDEEDTVVQFHPKKSEYVNMHPYCLHMWRKVGEEYELPL